MGRARLGYGCGSKPMAPFWLVGEFTHFRLPILVVGLVDVHWELSGVLTHGHISLTADRSRTPG